MKDILVGPMGSYLLARRATRCSAWLERPADREVEGDSVIYMPRGKPKPGKPKPVKRPYEKYLE